jgi:hypothetical protein
MVATGHKQLTVNDVDSRRASGLSAHTARRVSTSDMNDDEIAVSRVERMRLRSLVTRDMDLASSLHADDYQLISPSGAALSKDEYLSRVKSKSLEYLVFEPISEMAVKSGAEVVVLRYLARIVPSVGVSDESEFRAWHTDLYQRREGKWLAVWSHATAITGELSIDSRLTDAGIRTPMTGSGYDTHVDVWTFIFGKEHTREATSGRPRC